MLGAYPLQQIHKSTPNGQKPMNSRWEILSVRVFCFFLSILFFLFSHFKTTEEKNWFLFSCVMQCFCTHQAKIQWFKSQHKPTPAATSKIQSCTWTMATLCSILLHWGTFTSPAVNRVVARITRSSIFLLAMALPTLPPMALVHCLILHLLTPQFLAQSQHPLLLHHHKVSQFSWWLWLDLWYVHCSVAICEQLQHGCYWILFSSSSHAWFFKHWHIG